MNLNSFLIYSTDLLINNRWFYNYIIAVIREKIRKISK